MEIIGTIFVYTECGIPKSVYNSEPKTQILVSRIKAGKILKIYESLQGAMLFQKRQGVGACHARQLRARLGRVRANF